MSWDLNPPHSIFSGDKHFNIPPVERPTSPGSRIFLCRILTKKKEERRQKDKEHPDVVVVVAAAVVAQHRQPHVLKDWFDGQKVNAGECTSILSILLTYQTKELM